MAENEAASNVREEFSKLSLDGKTSFLVEAVFSTAGTAIHEIGDRLSSLVELVTGSIQAATSGEAEASSDAPAPDDSKEESGGKSSKR